MRGRSSKQVGQMHSTCRGSAEAGADQTRNAIILVIVDDGEQRVDTVTAGRCDDAELGQVRPDRVGHAVRCHTMRCYSKSA